jgi:hypothetical protein
VVDFRVPKDYPLANTDATGNWYWCSTGLRAGISGVRVPIGAGNISLHHRVLTGSGAHTSSYPMGTRGSFPGDKG